MTLANFILFITPPKNGGTKTLQSEFFHGVAEGITVIVGDDVGEGLGEEVFVGSRVGVNVGRDVRVGVIVRVGSGVFVGVEVGGWMCVGVTSTSLG